MPYCTDCGKELNEDEDLNKCPFCGINLEEYILKTPSDTITRGQAVRITDKEKKKTTFYSCPLCNKELAYIKDHKQWYCYSCRKYPFLAYQTPVQPQQTSWEFNNLNMSLTEFMGEVQDFFTDRGYYSRFETHMNETALIIKKGSTFWKGKAKIYFKGDQNQFSMRFIQDSNSSAFLKGGLIGHQYQKEISDIIDYLPHFAERYCSKIDDKKDTDVTTNSEEDTKEKPEEIEFEINEEVTDSSQEDEKESKEIEIEDDSEGEEINKDSIDFNECENNKEDLKDVAEWDGDQSSDDEIDEDKSELEIKKEDEIKKEFERKDAEIETNTIDDDEIFKICPYCGKSLNLANPPKFCPYCKMTIISDK